MHSYSAPVIKTPTTPATQAPGCGPDTPSRSIIQRTSASPRRCSNKTSDYPEAIHGENELNRFRPACAIIAAPNPSQGITQRQPDVIVANNRTQASECRTSCAPCQA